MKTVSIRQTTFIVTVLTWADLAPSPGATILPKKRKKNPRLEQDIKLKA